MESFPRELRTIEDLIALLEAEPVWVDRLRSILFTQGLLSLPDRVARLEELMQKQGEWMARISDLLARYDQHLQENTRRLEEHTQALNQHSERIARLEQITAQHSELMAQHAERIARLEELMAQHSERIARLEELMAQHSERIARLEELVAQHSERIARLEELVAQNTERIAQLEKLSAEMMELLRQHGQRLDAHEQRLNKLTDDVAFLKGMVLEIRTTLRIPSVFGRLVRRCRQADMNEVFERAYALQEAGELTDEEVEELLNLDLVVEGRLRTNGQVPILLAVEVSFVIDARDVERAAQRAALLSRVMGQPARGVVVGTQLTAEGKEAAAEKGVDWILQVLPRGD